MVYKSVIELVDELKKLGVGKEDFLNYYNWFIKGKSDKLSPRLSKLLIERASDAGMLFDKLMTYTIGTVRNYNYFDNKDDSGTKLLKWMYMFNAYLNGKLPKGSRVYNWFKQYSDTIDKAIDQQLRTTDRPMPKFFDDDIDNVVSLNELTPKDINDLNLEELVEVVNEGEVHTDNLNDDINEVVDFDDNDKYKKYYLLPNNSIAVVEVTKGTSEGSIYNRIKRASGIQNTRSYQEIDDYEDNKDKYDNFELIFC